MTAASDAILDETDALAEMAVRLRRAKRLAPDSAIVTDCALIIDNARRSLLEAAAIEARHQGEFA